MEQEKVVAPEVVRLVDRCSFCGTQNAFLGKKEGWSACCCRSCKKVFWSKAEVVQHD